jgi:hypothetical protein
MPETPGVDAVRRCSFCGTKERNGSRLFVGRDCLVCADCVDLANDILDEEVEDTSDRSDAAGLVCSSCGADGATVAKLIAGPEHFLCDTCARRFAAELPPDRPRWRPPLTMRVVEGVFRLVFRPLWWLRRIVLAVRSRAPSR